MVHDNHPSLEEKLQQQTSALLARRFKSVETEIQRLQASINEFCERLLAQTGGQQVSEEEIADLSVQFKQVLSAETDRNSTHAVAEAMAQAEQEFQRRLEATRAESEAHINSLRSQLTTSQQPVAHSPSGNFGLLRQAIADLDAQRTQAEALTTLVNQASQFAPRIVFFVVKSGSAIGWKACGFANGLNDETVRALTVPIPSSRLLREAVDQQCTVTATGETTADIVTFLGQYGSSRPEAAVTIPLTVRGKTAAVLYADSGNQPGSAINVEAIESLLQVTSLVVEVLPVRRSTDQGRPAVAEAPARVTAAPQPVAPVPSIPAATPAPVFYGGLGEEQPTRVETITPSEQAAPAFASVAPAVQAAPVIAPVPSAPEAPVSFAPAPAVEPQPEPAPSTGSFTSSPSTSEGTTQRATNILPGNASEAEVRAHNDARRFARLLVSEIKLYNETKVAEGRRSNDLYERLKEDIDRSRQMYEKRVPANVATKYDYFYDELVHTLAEGDAHKLGSGCPPPTVSAN